MELEVDKFQSFRSKFHGIFELIWQKKEWKQQSVSTREGKHVERNFVKKELYVWRWLIYSENYLIKKFSW